MEFGEQTRSAPLLEVGKLRKSFFSGGWRGRSHRVVAAQDVSFQIERGEAVALVGESGSGKSTIARLLLRLDSPESGEIRLDGQDLLTREPRKASLAYRGRVQMVFQDPFGSLNPVHDVAHHLVRPLLRHGWAQADAPGPAVESLNPTRDVAHHLVRPQVRHGRAGAAEARVRALELLRTVGLEPAEEFIDRHPYELSGGQRQRVAIARALAVEPDLLVADEPTSMLDVSIRMGILNLLDRLKRERQLAILLITHDLASARHLADRVLVLFQGRIVEDGPMAAVVESPSHPYTRALLEAIAGGRDRAETTRSAPAERGGVISADGCPFAARCPDEFEACRASDPAPREVDGRRVRCHLYPDGGDPQ